VDNFFISEYKPINMVLKILGISSAVH